MSDEQETNQSGTTPPPAPGAEAAGGSEGQSSGDTATSPPRLTPLQEVQFNALRCAYGHEDREAFFSFCHRIVMFFVTLFGTAAFASLTTEFSWFNAKYIAFMVTVLGLTDLVFDLSGNAREHGRHRYRFLELYGEAQVATEGDVVGLNRKLHQYYADETIVHKVINAVAENRTIRTMGGQADQMLHIPICHRLLRQFHSRRAYDYETISQREKRRSNLPWYRRLRR